MIDGLSVLTMQWHVISMDGYLFFCLVCGRWGMLLRGETG